MLYKVWVRLECEYDDIEADSPEEAFHIASDAAMGRRLLGLSSRRN